MKDQKEIKQLKNLSLNTDVMNKEYIETEISRLQNENEMLSQLNITDKIRSDIQKNKNKLKTLIHNQRRLSYGS